MSSMHEDVAEFHIKILNDPPPQLPTMNDELWVLERFKFLCEEVDEFYEHAQGGDIVKAVDGLLDTIYVALGTLYQMGVPIQACWDAVQKANMAKVRGITKRGMRVDAVKPEGWKDPHADIAKAIGIAIDQTNN